MQITKKLVLILGFLMCFTITGFADEPKDLSIEKASPAEQISYALGYNIFDQLKASLDLDLKFFMMGAKDSNGNTLKISSEKLQQLLVSARQMARNRQMEKIRKQADANRAAGEKFLKANRLKKGVVTLPSGLQYKILKTGTGPVPKLSDTVECNYRGTLIDGTEFDSSYKRGKPASFQVEGVIKGWVEALQMMNVGSKWKLYNPADLAYGDRGAGQVIKPGSTLVFEVELLNIVK